MISMARPSSNFRPRSGRPSSGGFASPFQRPTPAVSPTCLSRISSCSMIRTARPPPIINCSSQRDPTCRNCAAVLPMVDTYCLPVDTTCSERRTGLPPVHSLSCRRLHRPRRQSAGTAKRSRGSHRYRIDSCCSWDRKSDNVPHTRQDARPKVWAAVSEVRLAGEPNPASPLTPCSPTPRSHSWNREAEFVHRAAAEDRLLPASSSIDRALRAP
ncbi:hypothetical protein ABIA10_006415 [Rhizobium leguminosarum]